jgi:hypothetical protein
MLALHLLNTTFVTMQVGKKLLANSSESNWFEIEKENFLNNTLKYGDHK